MNLAPTLGWDIGGAHLKVATLSCHGELCDVVQLPCEIWRGLESLERAAKGLLDDLEPTTRHAVTMTAELADLFPDRATGVTAIVTTMGDLLPQSSIMVYAGRRGFVGLQEVDAYVDQIASANWLASAAYAARRVGDALLVDIGSTTTDVVPIRAGQIATESRTDGERMTRDELIYSGVVRTPICGLADRVPFRGEWQSLAAEVFATAGDCYRLLGWLPGAGDQAPTADGRGKSVVESARRLGRMLGRDADAKEIVEWRQVAAYLARKQMSRIQDSLERVLSGAGLAPDVPLIGAGVGRFLAARMAAQMERPYRDIGSLLEGSVSLRDRAADCFPAVAVAALAEPR